MQREEPTAGNSKGISGYEPAGGEVAEDVLMRLSREIDEAENLGFFFVAQ